MVFREFLTILRASNPEFVAEVQNAFANVTNTLPTSGDSGRGQAFGQTGPSTGAEQRRLVLEAERNDTTWPFAGL